MSGPRKLIRKLHSDEAGPDDCDPLAAIEFLFHLVKINLILGYGKDILLFSPLQPRRHHRERSCCKYKLVITDGLTVDQLNILNLCVNRNNLTYK